MLTGALLAGGMSRRYGRNKVLEPFEGERLIDRGIRLVGGMCDPVLVVANDLSFLLGVRATLVRDIVPHQGPLGGIYTALLFSPHDRVFVRGTDMPFLVPEFVKMLKEWAEQGYDAVVPVLNDYFEPLTAVYHRRCLPAVAETLERSERQIISFFKSIRLKAVSEQEWRAVDPAGLSFLNVNTPQDMEALGGSS